MNYSVDNVLLGSAVLLPLFFAVCGLLPRMRGVAAAGTTPAGAAGLAAALCVSAESTLDLPWTVLGLRLGLDETGRTFLFFSAILWLLAGLYGRGYFRGQERAWLYHVFYAFAMAGNFGLILARDAVTFYVFFALMSFASYGLVVHNRTDFALRAGRIYIVLVVAGEVALFAGLVALIGRTGINVTLPAGEAMAASPAALALLTAGFGIKAGMLSLHTWLPLAHPAAPVPASAVLSGAMIKAGLLGWLRFLPVGQDGYASWGTFFIIAGLAAAFYGVAAGLVQTDPKTILAYSSISQMGFMTLGVGAGWMAPELWSALLVAVTVYALHHGLAKGALFLSAGIAPGGMSRWSWAGVAVPALALAGAPLTSGAVAKSALKYSAHELPGSWPAVLGVLLPVAAIATGLLMARFVVALREYHSASHGDADRRWMVPAWAALVLASVAVIWFWEPGAGFAQGTLKAGKIFKAAWPLLVVAAAGLAVYRWPPEFLTRWIGRVPPGDLVVPAEAVLLFLRRTVARAAGRFPRRAAPDLGNLVDRVASRMLGLEKSLGVWRRVLIVLLGLALLLFALSMAAAAK